MPLYDANTFLFYIFNNSNGFDDVIDFLDSYESDRDDLFNGEDTPAIETAWSENPFWTISETFNTYKSSVLKPQSLTAAYLQILQWANKIQK